MSTQPAAAKPTLQGVRIKTRKGAAKAHAKHEPTVFRDQLYKHLDTAIPGDFDSVTNKLVSAGATLEFLKYADALFEILLVGGLLQPGGSYLEDGTPPSAWSIMRAKEPVEVDDMRNYVEVLNKLVRRYKYLQRPLEENSLPSLLQYIQKWTLPQREKFAAATGLLISQGLANATALQNLTKDHLVKDDTSLNFVTSVLQIYLRDQTMDHLTGTLKRGGIKDIAVFFPPNKRSPAIVEAHFRATGLSQVADWYAKRQSAAAKDNITKGLKEMIEAEETTDDIVSFLKKSQADSTMSEGDFVQCVWQGLMASVDLGTKSEQVESIALREITNYAPILEPFCTNAKTEVSLINTVQVHCYDDTRLMKSFPQIVKVLYNKDCVSDQAIVYWYQKGSKPQGRQHFLKAMEALVKFLQEQESEDEEE